MVLDTAIKNSPTSARLYRVRAEIESFNKGLFGWLDRLCEIYEQAADNEQMHMRDRVAFSGHLYGILERESKDMKKISAAYDLHRALRKELQRVEIRANKQHEIDSQQDIAKDSATARGPSAAPDGSVFINPHRDRAPKVPTNIPSTRVADYSSVGGEYHTYQSSGAYGNSYTWTYGKGIH